jgi:diguanylate cyclase (GGDEF)-like protein
MPWRQYGKETDTDQAASDADQSIADADQSASDTDQTASDRDQTAAEIDQRASDRDQRAAQDDLAQLGEPDRARLSAYEHSRTDRGEGTLDRQMTAVVRAQVSAERDGQADRRDEHAVARDLVADDRDREAEQRDRESDEVLKSEPVGASDAIEAAMTLRQRSAEDRRRAAEDRHRASEDRLQASRDRQDLYEQLEHAHLDELTGAYRRALGEAALLHEIHRAQRLRRDLVLAYVDVDSLKAVNDTQGHASGDALLRNAVTALRSRLGPHDPIVRLGGDEFVCIFTNTTLEEGRRRLDEANELLAVNRPGSSITVGLAELQQEDTLETLMERGDRALLAAKHPDPTEGS